MSAVDARGGGPAAGERLLLRLPALRMLPELRECCVTGCSAAASPAPRT